MCEHEPCNRDSAGDMTTEEVKVVLDCLVDQGVLVQEEDGRYRKL